MHVIALNPASHCPSSAAGYPSVTHLFFYWCSFPVRKAPWAGGEPAPPPNYPVFADCPKMDKGGTFWCADTFPGGKTEKEEGRGGREGSGMVLPEEGREEGFTEGSSGGRGDGVCVQEMLAAEMSSSCFYRARPRQRTCWRNLQCYELQSELHAVKKHRCCSCVCFMESGGKVLWFFYDSVHTHTLLTPALKWIIILMWL